MSARVTWCRSMVSTTRSIVTPPLGMSTDRPPAHSAASMMSLNPAAQESDGTTR